MNLFRVALPGIIGALFVLFGIQPVFTGLQAGDTGGLVGGLHTAVIPTAIGIALLLATVAVARRTRLGYLLGIAAGILLAIAGLWVILLEIPFFNQGGLNGAIAGPFMVIAAVWSLVWLLYGWRISKTRATYAPDWLPNDHRLGIALVGLAVVTAVVFVALGLVGRATIG